MKNSLIHSGLENSNLRDFLSISMVKTYERQFKNQKGIYPSRIFDESPIDHSIRLCENDIKFYMNKLQILKEQQAIVTLIKMQGWDEFDVSDETEKDSEYTLYMNFIGTNVEFTQLIKQFQKNKNEKI